MAEYFADGTGGARPQMPGKGKKNKKAAKPGGKQRPASEAKGPAMKDRKGMC